MDNKQLNINGSGKDFLLMAVTVALHQQNSPDPKLKPQRAVSFSESESAGLLIHWYHEPGKSSKFLSEIDSPSLLTHLIWEWLQTNPKSKMEGWDANADHDGDNEMGWRIYVEDWGHVEDKSNVIFAVKPAFLWFGK